jgi:uncharacterized protein YkwD
MTKPVLTWTMISGIALALLLLLRPMIGLVGVSTASIDTENVQKGTVSKPPPKIDLSAIVTSPPRYPLPDPARLPGDPVPADISFIEQVEDMILDRSNQERKKQGKTSLSKEYKVRDIARAHSIDMIQRNFFQHMNPDGRAPTDRMALFHRSFIGLTGENIWKGSTYDTSNLQKLTDDIMNGWMNSPGHRANILRDDYTHLGVGVVLKNGEVYATQNFISLYAYSSSEIPEHYSNGNKLELFPIHSLKKGLKQPDSFDLFHPLRGTRAAGPFSIDSAINTAEKGKYHLRFYFPKPDGAGSVICPGPEIIIN